VADVPRVLLQQVKQHALQRRRIRAVPALARLPDVGEIVRLDDRTAAVSLLTQAGQQCVQRFFRADVPPSVPLFGPWVVYNAPLEAPLEPAEFDEAQVLDQLERGPAGRQPAAAQLGGGQALELARQLGAEVIQVAEEHLGARTRGRGGFRERYGHICD
jgi:hypothetical protein